MERKIKCFVIILVVLSFLSSFSTKSSTSNVYLLNPNFSVSAEISESAFLGFPIPFSVVVSVDKPIELDLGYEIVSMNSETQEILSNGTLHFSREATNVEISDEIVFSNEGKNIIFFRISEPLSGRIISETALKSVNVQKSIPKVNIKKFSVSDNFVKIGNSLKIILELEETKLIDYDRNLKVELFQETSISKKSIYTTELSFSKNESTVKTDIEIPVSTPGVFKYVLKVMDSEGSVLTERRTDYPVISIVYKVQNLERALYDLFIKYKVPEYQAKVLSKTIAEEHTKIGGFDPLLLAAVGITESHLRNVRGFDGRAAGYFQLWDTATKDMARFYSDIKIFLDKSKDHFEILDHPDIQVKVAYRYLAHLMKLNRGDVFKVLTQYNGRRGHKYNIYVQKVLSNYESLLRKVSL